VVQLAQVGAVVGMSTPRFLASSCLSVIHRVRIECTSEGSILGELLEVSDVQRHIGRCRHAEVVSVEGLGVLMSLVLCAGGEQQFHVQHTLL
jgi:hypothetical protein